MAPYRRPQPPWRRRMAVCGQLLLPHARGVLFADTDSDTERAAKDSAARHDTAETRGLSGVSTAVRVAATSQSREIGRDD